MTGGTILFWVLAIAAGLGAFAVVVTQNVVRMAFWLVVSLGSTAGLYFLLHADFVAATQILIYVGGTVVLLIFGVMLTASGPYSRLKMSPGNLIIVGALGATVFFIVFLTIGNVNWDRSVLRQVAIAEEKFDAVRKDVGEADDKETQELLDEKFESFESQYHVPDPSGETAGKTETVTLYRLSPEAELTSEQEERLTVVLDLLRKNGLTFSPTSETGGTIRPLGFSLLGARPDRDLGVPAKLQRLSDGFYVVAPATEHVEDAQSAKGEPHEPTLSTGYLLPFEIASVHLLVVLIGAAYLARAKRRVETIP